MQRDIQLDHFSISSVPIYMYRDETLLSHGTGFFYKKNSDTYLVTNLHNLSGKNLETGKCLSSNGGIPNKITFEFYCINSEEKLIRYSDNVKLYNQDENSIWLNHKNDKIDIALLKMNAFRKCTVFAINELNCHDMLIEVGMEAFVLGFPVKMFTDIIPIWKRATIASEYDFNVNNMHQFLIDTATYSGMSGAPVILRSRSYRDNKGNVSSVISHNIPTKFIGIYSGRLSLDNTTDKDFTRAQLGVVWKKELIDEIIDYP